MFRRASIMGFLAICSRASPGICRYTNLMPAFLASEAHTADLPPEKRAAALFTGPDAAPAAFIRTVADFRCDMAISLAPSFLFFGGRIVDDKEGACICCPARM